MSSKLNHNPTPTEIKIKKSQKNTPEKIPNTFEYNNVNEKQDIFFNIFKN